MATCARQYVKAFLSFCCSVSKTTEKFGIYRPTVYNSEENGTDERRKRAGGATP
jgi:hypothetical protein